jgi:hypothetical protein
VTARELLVDEQVPLRDRGRALSRMLAERDPASLVSWARESVTDPGYGYYADDAALAVEASDYAAAAARAVDAAYYGALAVYRDRVWTEAFRDRLAACVARLEALP